MISHLYMANNQGNGIDNMKKALKTGQFMNKRPDA